MKTKQPPKKLINYNGHFIMQFRADRAEAIKEKIKYLNEDCRYCEEDISCRLNINLLTLRGYMKLLGMKVLNKRGWHKHDTTGWEAKIPILLAQGLTYAQISPILNTNVHAISRWVCNNGLSNQKIQ